MRMGRDFNVGKETKKCFSPSCALHDILVSILCLDIFICSRVCLHARPTFRRTDEHDDDDDDNETRVGEKRDERMN